jgi:hypothetical protein
MFATMGLKGLKIYQEIMKLTDNNLSKFDT